MRYEELPLVVRNVLGTHEVFRKLGFSADDLYVSLNRTPEVPVTQVGVFVILKTQGREFSVTCGGWPMGKDDELQALWNRAVDAYNSGDLSDRDGQRILEESPAFRRAPELLLLLKDKGFQIPDAEELNQAWAKALPS